MIKILHVNHLLDPVTGGGTAERTFQLARFLTSLDAECGLLTLDIGDTSPYEALLTTEKLYKLPCINQRYYIHFSWPRYIRKIVSQYDVVHLMGHWTLLNAIVAMVCRSLNKPYVVCPAGSLIEAGSSRLLKKTYNWFLGHTLVKQASAWVAVTEDEKSDFLIYGIAPEMVNVIPNGIDPTQYQSNYSLRTDISEKVGTDPYVLFLGRLNHIKGPDLLLKAFESLAGRYPAANLVFAGPDSGMMETLSHFVAESDLSERVHFAGYVGGDDKVSLLRNATCLVIPSRNEAMSVVVLEAGICSTPVVFTDRCGLDEFAKANAGLVVNPDVAAIAKGLDIMLADSSLQRRLASNLKKIVARNYLWVSQAQKYMNLYQKVTRGH